MLTFNLQLSPTSGLILLIQASLKYTTSLENSDRRENRDSNAFLVYAYEEKSKAQILACHRNAADNKSTYIFCRAWAMTMPLVKSSTVLHGASTPNVWIWMTNRHKHIERWLQDKTMQSRRAITSSKRSLVVIARFLLHHPLSLFFRPPYSSLRLAQTELNSFRSACQRSTCRRKRGYWEQECWSSDRKKMTRLKFCLHVAPSVSLFISWQALKPSAALLVAKRLNRLAKRFDGAPIKSLMRGQPWSTWSNRIEMNSSWTLICSHAFFHFSAFVSSIKPFQSAYGWNMSLWRAATGVELAIICHLTRAVSSDCCESTGCRLNYLKINTQEQHHLQLSSFHNLFWTNLIKEKCLNHFFMFLITINSMEQYFIKTQKSLYQQHDIQTITW